MNFGRTVKLNPVGILLLAGILLISLLYVFVHKPIAVEKEINLKHLLAASIYVAEEGGQVIRIFDDRNFSKKSKGKTKEGANDFVTDADYRSHCLMYYSLRIHFPSVKVSTRCGESRWT